MAAGSDLLRPPGVGRRGLSRRKHVSNLNLISIPRQLLCRSYTTNPILDYQPVFARSLPIQVLLTGIIFTLTCVLVLHLLFTAQYHWPLAPVNFVLQFAGVLSLLVTQIATLHVVTAATMLESKNWPYMLTYLAVDIPPLDDTSGWTTAELAAWLIMNAVTSGLIQVCFDQFHLSPTANPLSRLHTFNS